MANTNFLSPHDFVLHFIFIKSPQNKFFFKSVCMISFSSKLYLKYMCLFSLILIIYLLHNFALNHQKKHVQGNPIHYFVQFSLNFYLSKFHWDMTTPMRLGTLQISCIYNDLWCLSYASVPVIASIFYNTLYLRSQRKDHM